MIKYRYIIKSLENDTYKTKIECNDNVCTLNPNKNFQKKHNVIINLNNLLENTKKNENNENNIKNDKKLKYFFKLKN